MTVTARLAFTLLIILAFAAVAFFRFEDKIVMIASATVAVVLVVVIWMVKQVKPEIGGTAKRPANLDNAAKRLIQTLKKNFDEDELSEIGEDAQDIIVTTAKAVNDGKVKNINRAIDGLEVVPPRRYAQETNLVLIAGTLASYYLQAEQKGEAGDDTRMCIDNFIAGIDDMDL